MNRVFKKLVRDKVPDIIRKKGEIPVTCILSNEDFKRELYKKLKEEVREVIKAENEAETLEELADVFEVVSAIAELNNRSMSDVVMIADAKRKMRGGFDNRIYLEETYSKEISK